MTDVFKWFLVYDLSILLYEAVKIQFNKIQKHCVMYNKF